MLFNGVDQRSAAIGRKGRPLKPFSSQHRCTGGRTNDTAAAFLRTGTGSQCSSALDCSIGLGTSDDASRGGTSFGVVALTNRTLSVTLGAGASAFGFPPDPNS